MATIPLGLDRPIRVPAGEVTFREFLALVPDGVKADLLNGVIFMASPDNLDANELNMWLAMVIGPFVEARDLGKVYMGRVAYRLGEKRAPEPDLAFVSKARLGKRRRGYFAGAPDMAIEIVSPDSIDRDYLFKRGIYEEAGVREYWILDPDHSLATFLRLSRKRFVEVKPVKNMIGSEVLPGLELDVRWLMSKKRPPSHEVVRKLLAR
jgi:Uma2 family endonuclease